MFWFWSEIALSSNNLKILASKLNLILFGGKTREKCREKFEPFERKQYSYQKPSCLIYEWSKNGHEEAFLGESHRLGAWNLTIRARVSSELWDIPPHSSPIWFSTCRLTICIFPHLSLEYLPICPPQGECFPLWPPLYQPVCLSGTWRGQQRGTVTNKLFDGDEKLFLDRRREKTCFCSAKSQVTHGIHECATGESPLSMWTVQTHF